LHEIDHIKNGVDYFQGYLFAKPLSPDDLAGHVERFVESDPIFEKVRRTMTVREG
jgi:hypothetical protein